MARKKLLHYATANGTPLAMGYPGQFGFRQGCLTKKVSTPQEATIYPGYRGLRKLNLLVSKMLAARESMANSVIFDWPALTVLTDLGIIGVTSVYEKDFIKSNDRPATSPEPQPSA